jgi:hypothetical protein
MICECGWRTPWPEAECIDDWSQGIPLSYTRKLAAGQLEARCRHRGQGRPGEHGATTECTSPPHRYRGLWVGQPGGLFGSIHRRAQRCVASVRISRVNESRNGYFQRKQPPEEFM